MKALDFLTEGLGPGTPEQVAERLEKPKAMEFLRGGAPGAPLTPEEQDVVAERERQAALEAQYVSGPQRFGAGMAKPVVELYRGVADLLGREPTPEERQQLDYLRAAKGSAATAGELVSELGLLAAPGGQVVRGARAVTRAPGLKRALATLGGESTLVGGYEAAKLPTEDLTRGERGALGAAFTAGTGGLMMSAGRVGKSAVLPRRFPKAREAYRVQAARRAQGEDEFIPLFRAVGERPQGLQASLTQGIQRRLMPTVPILSEALEKGVRESDTAMRDAMFKRSLPDDANIPLTRGREGTTTPVGDTVRDVQNFYRSEYQRILEPYSFPISGNRFQRIVSQAPKKARKKLFALLDGARDGDTIPGENIKNVQRELREYARTAKLDTEKQTFWAYDDALEDVLQRRIGWQDPQLLADYKRLARPYRNFLVVQDAARAKAKQGGEFTAEDLIQAAKVKRGQPRSVVAAAQGPLQREALQEAAVGQRFQGTENPYLGMATFGLATGGVPAATGLVGGPYAAAVPSFFGAQTIASAYRPVQQYLMREQPWQKRIADELRRRRGTYGRLRRGATYAAGTQGPEEFED